MAKKHTRLNVTLDANTLLELSELATYEKRSLSEMAKELISDAIDRREDAILSRLSDARLQKNTKIFTHQEAWK